MEHAVARDRQAARVHRRYPLGNQGTTAVACQLQPCGRRGRLLHCGCHVHPSAEGADSEAVARCHGKTVGRGVGKPASHNRLWSGHCCNHSSGRLGCRTNNHVHCVVDDCQAAIVRIRGPQHVDRATCDQGRHQRMWWCRSRSVSGVGGQSERRVRRVQAVGQVVRNRKHRNGSRRIVATNLNEPTSVGTCSLRFERLHISFVRGPAGHGIRRRVQLNSSATVVERLVPYHCHTTASGRQHTQTPRRLRQRHALCKSGNKRRVAITVGVHSAQLELIRHLVGKVADNSQTRCGADLAISRRGCAL